MPAELRRARARRAAALQGWRRGCSGARSPDGYSLNMHPMAFAAWFGLLATALNLFPIGQLDGGHISYAVLGRASSHVTLVMLGVAIGADVFLGELDRLDRPDDRDAVHVRPRTIRATFDEDVPLDRTRLVLALFALVMFVLCFTPAPIEPMELHAEVDCRCRSNVMPVTNSIASQFQRTLSGSTSTSSGARARDARPAPTAALRASACGSCP